MYGTHNLSIMGDVVHTDGTVAMYDNCVVQRVHHHSPPPTTCGCASLPVIAPKRSTAAFHASIMLPLPISVQPARLLATCSACVLRRMFGIQYNTTAGLPCTLSSLDVDEAGNHTPENTTAMWPLHSLHISLLEGASHRSTPHSTDTWVAGNSTDCIHPAAAE